MANIELKKVEEQLNHRVLYSVKVNADANHMEFPIGIEDQGSATANETAVLTSALAFAEDTRGGGATEARTRRAWIGSVPRSCGAGPNSLPERNDPYVSFLGSPQSDRQLNRQEKEFRHFRRFAAKAPQKAF